jgi:hypothetical protein
MNSWVDSRRTIAIQEVASHVSSSLQQLYSSLNHDKTIPNEITVTYNLDIPQYIENYPYKGEATSRTVGVSGSKVLELTLSYVGASISTTASATFEITWNGKILRFSVILLW